MSSLSDTLVNARNTVVRFLVENGEMPGVQQVAQSLSISEDAAADLLRQLHGEHALLLDADGSIRMLWPFSGVPTPFQVTANGHNYWANCAWDALGIPAALHTDAVIQAFFTSEKEPVTLTVENGRVSPDPYWVHFPLPASRWYDDLVYT